MITRINHPTPPWMLSWELRSESFLPLPSLPVALVKPRYFPVRLPLGGFCFQVGALIRLFLALADADFDFDAVALPIHPQGDEGVPFDLGELVETVDLLAMEQEAPAALRLVLLVAGLGIRLHVGFVEKGLAALDTREGVVQVGETGADRFDLGASKLQASFHSLENVVIAKRLAIDGNVCAHCGGAGRQGLLGFNSSSSDQLVGELAFDDFLERDIGEAHPHAMIDHGSLTLRKLANTPGDDVHQDLLVGNFL